MGLGHAKATFSKGLASWGKTSSTNTKIKLEGSVLVQNLDYSKNIGVYATTDDWNTTLDITASYDRTIPGFGYSMDVEVWEFATTNLVSTSSASHVEFAIYYEDGSSGTTYWDNNFEDEYWIYQPALSRSRDIY